MEIQEAIKLINENMESDQVKAFLQPIKDQHFSRSLDTWKKNTLPDIIKESTQPPAETPEQIKLKEMQQEIDRIKTEKEQAEFVAAGVSKGLSETVSKALFINGNKELSGQAIAELEGQFRKMQDELKIYKTNGTPPAGGNSTLSTVSLERINDLSADEIYKNLDKLQG